MIYCSKPNLTPVSYIQFFWWYPTGTLSPLLRTGRSAVVFRLLRRLQPGGARGGSKHHQLRRRRRRNSFHRRLYQVWQPVGANQGHRGGAQLPAGGQILGPLQCCRPARAGQQAFRPADGMLRLGGYPHTRQDGIIYTLRLLISSFCFPYFTSSCQSLLLLPPPSYTPPLCIFL